jgi:hypothetical protein
VEERLSFYIRAMDGLHLPTIMQWLKQTFAVRFNLYTGRTEHVCGDRYWSRVLEWESPEEAGETDWEAADVAAETGKISFAMCPPDGGTPLMVEIPVETGFSPQNPARSPPPPGQPPKPGPEPHGITSTNLLRKVVRKRHRERSIQSLSGCVRLP